MENLLLEQYSLYKKQQLEESPFKCLLNADIEPNPHQINAFCAAIQDHMVHVRLRKQYGSDRALHISDHRQYEAQ